MAEIRNLPAYRQAFEERVANIDWDSEFITPWDGNASWSGLSWDGLRRQHLFSMWSWVQRRDYEGLESAFRADCCQYACEAAATAIDALPFGRYQEELQPGLRRAIEGCVKQAGAHAIYLRIRPDLDWSGEFHLAGEAAAEPFSPREEGSYSGPLAEFEAPSFPEAAKVREEFPRQNPLDPGGAWHYLIARTVAAFGRCLAQNRAPVPVYFSGVYALFRM